MFAPDKPLQWLSLLYTNKKIHHEACVVLYSLNIFYLEDRTRNQRNLLQSFLNCIGDNNASFLSHLCIDFPIVERADRSGQFELKEDDFYNLKLLKEKCTTLMVLELLLYGRNLRALTKAIGNDPQPVQDALGCTNSRLQRTSSLCTTTVRCFGEIPSYLADLTKNLGWKIL